ncbi:autotransporter domain-containing protein [Anaerobiospirillum succiniciproducens]|uniref:autotransporter domain-containing protein n=1 Tax=Anaerobiospirillum succiniciproducens TaxID=13335 RepID=UPI000429ED92|nr:autotransporter outer membrane beta-barrel domain-containing protein [Anaerobiospirillum succiniciproducens]
MKQTNNAIKFLMAQYRAVFKHAYLASLGASLVAATALLSAPAAAAAAPQGPTTATAMDDAAFKAHTDPELVIGGDGATHNKLTLTAALADSAAKEVNITLKAGESTFLGVAAVTSPAPGTPAKTNLDLSAATLNINQADPATAAKLTIGDGTNAVKVKLESLTVTKGTLELNSAAKANATLETGPITIGAAAESAPKQPDAVVNIGAGGVLGKSGAQITVNTTGKVSASGEGAKLIGNVAISGGTVAADESMTIEGDLTANAGALTTKQDKTATVTGNATFTGKDSLTNSGTLVVKGDAVFADKSVKESTGSVTFTKTASMNGDTLKKFLAGEVKSADSAHAVLTVSGSGSVALDSTGLTLIDESGDGAINANLKNGADGTLTVHVAQGTLASNAISGAAATQSGVVLSFDTLTLGNGKGDVTAKAANLKVSKALTVSGDHALVLSDASKLTLKAADQVLKTIGGKGVTVGAAAGPSGSPAGSAGSLAVEGGKWSVKDLNIVSGAATVTNSTLTVTGTLTTTAGAGDTDPAAGSITADASTIDVLGSGGLLAIKKGGVTLENTAELHVDATDIFQDGKKTLDNNKVASGSLVGGSNTVLVIKDANGKDLSLTQAEFKALKAANTGFKGLYKVNISDLQAPTGPVELGSVEGNNTSDVYEKTTVTVTDGAATPVDKVISVGNIQVKNDKDLSLGEGGAVTLNTPSADGFFVSKSGASGTEVANVTFKEADNALTLYGSGQIGAIVNGSSATGGSLTVGSESKNGDVVVKGSIGQTGAGKDVQSVIVNKGSKLKVEGDLYTKSLDLAKGTSLNANNGEGAVVINGKGSILGNVTAGSLEFAKAGTDTDKIKNTIAGDVEVNVGSLSIADHNVLTIGQDGAAETSTTATVFTNSLKMSAGSTIFVDPSYQKPATVLGTKTLTDGTTDDGVNVAAGNIIVGKNAAFGLGFDKAEFNSVMANYLVDGKFTDPAEHKGGYANALVLGDSLVIASGNGVSVDHNLTDEKVAEGTAATPDNVKLGAKAALIITDKAFGADKQGAAITFGKTGENVSDAKVVSEDSSVISLVGDFDANDTNLKIFAAVDGGAAGTVKIQNANGITVKALGGLLEGTLSGTTGTLDKLQLSPDADKKAYDGVARPVGDFFLGLANGNYAVDSTQAGHKFVTAVADTAGGFKVVDTAAHAATYAGAQQAAVASVTTMADAMFGRVGAVGVEAASISATGSQANGGVWLTPMYKSLDADGFNAEGASYGSEVDLGGVAFGADTVNGNMRFGAVFNIGSGDADGKGQGNGLKDEFDYYGFGIYSAMGFGSFALVGDASMTVISHEVEGLGLRGKADTTAVTMGLTGQYTVATPAVDVTPHLAARFIRLNTDSYDLIGADGAIATTDFDVQNVFSVPLGVTLSKAFVAGGWSLAPSADLTVAFNTGDTEAKSTTTFSGIGHGINLNTEVLDEVQYGVTFGLGAQNGAFGTSLNVNYTGSSNTDSFGVNAQCRYMF